MSQSQLATGDLDPFRSRRAEPLPRPKGDVYKQFNLQEALGLLGDKETYLLLFVSFVLSCNRSWLTSSSQRILHELIGEVGLSGQKTYRQQDPERINAFLIVVSPRIPRRSGSANTT